MPFVFAHRVATVMSGNVNVREASGEFLSDSNRVENDYLAHYKVHSR